MTSVSKNLYIDKLDAIVNKDNNTYHNTITYVYIIIIYNIYKCM